ncbi:MAG TPA: hypothetical protein VNX67_07955, partial [Solirubrobacteraceae bacterium]|nr:hypothetical protein [Solirubrobacteraceae bacterium]
MGLPMRVLVGMLLLAAASLAVLVVSAAMLGVTMGISTSSVAGDVTAYAVSARARTEIPREYLALYTEAAARYGLDWAILAGIGKVECDHGRDPDPSC